MYDYFYYFDIYINLKTLYKKWAPKPAKQPHSLEVKTQDHKLIKNTLIRTLSAQHVKRYIRKIRLPKMYYLHNKVKKSPENLFINELIKQRLLITDSGLHIRQ
jgi:hypothetical protein